ncbi:MAG: T9SS type A sorting domain-containing protein [Candidatus Mcinerneyibacterium aminivorans]|jgi:hypothetical protein|uniref:T9SS type A sorting domain-containing protein n=1 Tax=Candidatus Mcinerneyibacterium aminivorans TaxID=2703815 RepID=A0A5D0MJ65_9BACT|nr:MAG: T9SS type A sorting domain-containing protein [Candidatus Mcinerneyibacterium aminivorans]
MKTQFKYFIIFLLAFLVFSPNTFALIHNPKPNPNPFKQGESVEFKTDYSSYQKVELYIYNLKGDLIHKQKKTSNFTETMTWDGKNMNGYYVAKGVYFYVLKITHLDGSEEKTDSIKGSIVFIK